MRKLILFVSCAAIIVAGSPAQAATPVKFESHRLGLNLDIERQMASITDSCVVEVAMGLNFFAIAPEMTEVSSLTLDGVWTEYGVVNLGDDGPEDLSEEMIKATFASPATVLFFRVKIPRRVSLVVSYEAIFADSVEGTRFSRENVGREVRGTIGEQGAYLSPSAFFYPRGDEEAIRFQVTANIPADWECVADGNLIANETVDGRKQQTWKNPFSNDGLMFMAAPYVTKSIMQDNIEVACYFFEADTGLIDDYLSSTAGYLSMYVDLIGPYPFERFTVAENFFPTGYGMPGWTLLGQQVLRLPFIRHISLGHEVLHNWWGNSVYVDYERGNWCEAMTVYGADYRYKLMQSPDAARDYRKNILKQYLAYVNEGNDFPVRAFATRTSPETRVIGYNKAMMAVHLIHEEIGDNAFFAAWKDIYGRYRGVKIAWEEWVESFERTSGKDLSHIIPQWIDQTGAPVLELAKAEMKKDESGKNVGEITVNEISGGDYQLRVPLRFADGESVVDTVLVVENGSGSISFNIPSPNGTIEVDPDYHIFRKLYDNEVEPIIAAVLGSKNIIYAVAEYSDSNDWDNMKSFAENMAGEPVEIIDYWESRPTANDSTALVLIGRNDWDVPLVPGITKSEGTGLIINGEEYIVGKQNVVTAHQLPDGGLCLLVRNINTNDLPRLGQLIPHYGKYSYLVFEGTKNIAKGQWEVTESPLKAELTVAK